MAKPIPELVSDEFMQKLRNSITEHLTKDYEELREAHNDLVQELHQTATELEEKRGGLEALQERFDEVRLHVGAHPVATDEEVVEILRLRLKSNR